MAEKIQPKMPIPPLLVTARPAKKSKKRKSEAEKAATKKRLEKARGQTRVNIGAAFKQWRQLRHLKGLKTDAEVAAFLLDGRLEDDFAAFRRWQREEGGTRAEKAVSGEEKKFPCESTEVARLEKRDSEPTPSTPRSYKKLCPAPPTPTLVPACAPPLILSRLATTMIVCQNLTEGAAGTNRIFPLKDAACQTDPPGTHFRSKGIQTKVARKDCGMCTLTFPLDSPLLFLQPTIVKRPSKRRRPSLEDEKKAPSKCKLAMEVFE